MEDEASRLPTFGIDADTLRGQVRVSLQHPPARSARLKASVGQTCLYIASRGLNLFHKTLERAGARDRVVCVICGWQGREFRTRIGSGWLQRNALCPGCLGVQRQRLMALALERDPLSGRILWIAPEECLQEMVEKRGIAVITADIEMPAVDVRADVEALPFASGTVECVVVSDVLEHVADDGAALREIRRVLGESGIAFIHVPILATETVEYGFVNWGDWGHRRVYGPDISQRLAEASIELIPFRADQFSSATRRRYGLLDWDVVVLARRARQESPV